LIPKSTEITLQRARCDVLSQGTAVFYPSKPVSSPSGEFSVKFSKKVPQSGLTQGAASNSQPTESAPDGEYQHSGKVMAVIEPG
jgi:hypothetical protein